MIKLQITKDMLARARECAHSLGSLRNSVKEGAGNIRGFLGEELVASLLPQAKRENTFHHDFRLGDLTLDVKSYGCTREPQGSFDCTVFDLSGFQKTEFYVFCRILNDLSAGWVLGVVSKADFLRESVIHLRGEERSDQHYPDGSPFVYLTDCRSMPASRLKPLANLLIYHWL